MLGVIVALFGLTSVDTLCFDAGFDQRQCFPARINTFQGRVKPVQLSLKSRDELKQLIQPEASAFSHDIVAVAIKLDNDWLLVDQELNARFGDIQGTFDAVKWEAIKARSAVTEFEPSIVFDVAIQNHSAKSVSMHELGTNRLITIPASGLSRVTCVNKEWAIANPIGSPSSRVRFDCFGELEKPKGNWRVSHSGVPAIGKAQTATVKIDLIPL